MKPEERWERSRTELGALSMVNRKAFIRELREALLEAAGICDEEVRRHDSICPTSHAEGTKSAGRAAKRIRALAGGEETKPAVRCSACGFIPGERAHACPPLTEERARALIDDHYTRLGIPHVSEERVKAIVRAEVHRVSELKLHECNRNVRITAREEVRAALSSLTIRSEEKT